MLDIPSWELFQSIYWDWCWPDNSEIQIFWGGKLLYLYHTKQPETITWLGRLWSVVSNSFEGVIDNILICILYNTE